MPGPFQFAAPRGPQNDQSGRASSVVASQLHASFFTSARGRIDEKEAQMQEFCRFLAREWRGSRHHSYTVPSRGKLSAWSRTIEGKWSAYGLADAVSKYAWNGQTFPENKIELDGMAANLQSAIQRNSNMMFARPFGR